MKKVLVPGLVAGVAMLIVGMAINHIFSLVFPSLSAEYQNANLMRPMSDPLMSLFFAWPFVLGLALAWAWDKVKGLLTGSFWSRATQFGIGYWLIATIPGMFITYVSFPVTWLLVLSWTVSGFVQALVAGAVFAKINA